RSLVLGPSRHLYREDDRGRVGGFGPARGYFIPGADRQHVEAFAADIEARRIQPDASAWRIHRRSAKRLGSGDGRSAVRIFPLLGVLMISRRSPRPSETVRPVEPCPACGLLPLRPARAGMGGRPMETQTPDKLPRHIVRGTSGQMLVRWIALAGLF